MTKKKIIRNKVVMHKKVWESKSGRVALWWSTVFMCVVLQAQFPGWHEKQNEEARMGAPHTQVRGTVKRDRALRSQQKQQSI